MFDWMAWTLPVAVFFTCIGLMLVVMTVWEIKSPTTLRRGWLPIVAVMTRTVSASGMDWGTLAAAGVITIVPGAIVIWFVRNYIAKGFAMGRV